MESFQTGIVNFLRWYLEEGQDTNDWRNIVKIPNQWCCAILYTIVKFSSILLGYTIL